MPLFVCKYDMCLLSVPILILCLRGTGEVKDFRFSGRLLFFFVSLFAVYVFILEHIIYCSYINREKMKISLNNSAFIYFNNAASPSDLTG